MTTQIAVRLPDDLVQALDKLVANGEVSSRADLVTRVLRREMRRRRALEDLATMGDHEPQHPEDPDDPDDPDDLAGLAAYVARTPLDID